MQRVDYARLEADVTNVWRTAQNKDDDPITAGQIRNAEVTGKLAAAMAKELDMVGDDGDLRMPFAIFAAVVANQLHNMVKRTDDPAAATDGCLAMIYTYVMDMLARDHGEPGEGYTGETQRVVPQKVEVPN